MLLSSGTLQQRLSRFGMIVVGVACLIIAMLQVAGNYVDEQQRLRNDLDALMDITSEVLQPYLVFGDAAGAVEQVRGVLRRPDILEIGIRDAEGGRFASVDRGAYGEIARPGIAAGLASRMPEGWLWGNSALFHHPIEYQGESIGMLELHVDLRPLWHAQLAQLGWVALSMFVAFGVATWIARRLRGCIIRPISELDRAAREIAASGQYSVRVARYGEDELGRLVDRFNEMLATIEAADHENREQRDELARQRTFLKTLLHTLPDLVWVKDPDGAYLACNTRFERFFGAAEEDIVGHTDHDFVATELADFFRANDLAAIEHGRSRVNEEWVSFADDGHRECLETIKTPLTDEQGRLLGVLGIGRDITERKQHQQHLERIVHFDVLTGLANRTLLADRLRQGMAQAQRHEEMLATVYLDLDGFKVVNDSHGHEIGDKLLKIVAARMADALREGDTLARMGGDEFVAVLPGLRNQDASIPVLKRLLETAAAPVLTDGLELRVSASAGVSFFPQAEGVDADQLLRQADEAMYEAKKTGKNRFHLFDAEHDQQVRSHFESLDAIREALAHDEFVLFYQPKVNMRHGEVVGAEALIRWQHPQRGLLPPAEFLPVLENSSLSIDLGEWVLESALSQIEDWRRMGLLLPVSINVGAFQLQRSDFVETLRHALLRHPEIRPGDIEIEVLETNALEDIEHAVRIINSCKSLGGQFALDDFGTGYSSLTYMKHLPVDMIKIDQSFVRDLLESPENLAILQSILDLAQAFGRTAIAEGIETQEHGELLLRLGCDLGQGYAIARPMPARAIPGWLSRWRPDPAWRHCAPIRHDDRHLLHAMIEHREWISRLGRFVQSGVESPPVDGRHCHFGRCLAQGSLQHRADHPAFARVVELHGQVHREADEVLQLRRAGDTGAATSRFESVRRLRNEWVDQLNQLIC